VRRSVLTTLSSAERAREREREGEGGKGNNVGCQHRGATHRRRGPDSGPVARSRGGTDAREVVGLVHEALERGEASVHDELEVADVPLREGGKAGGRQGSVSTRETRSEGGSARRRRRGSRAGVASRERRRTSDRTMSGRPAASLASCSRRGRSRATRSCKKRRERERELSGQGGSEEAARAGVGVDGRTLSSPPWGALAIFWEQRERKDRKGKGGKGRGRGGGREGEGARRPRKTPVTPSDRLTSALRANGQAEARVRDAQRAAGCRSPLSPLRPRRSSSSSLLSPVAKRRG